MTHERQRHRRLVTALLVICLAVFAQSVALSGQRGPHHSPDHCCLLCHVGPLPFLQAGDSAVLPSALKVVWLALTPPFETSSDVRRIPRPSRAPPAV